MALYPTFILYDKIRCLLRIGYSNLLTETMSYKTPLTVLIKSTCFLVVHTIPIHQRDN